MSSEKAKYFRQKWKILQVFVDPLRHFDISIFKKNDNRLHDGVLVNVQHRWIGNKQTHEC